MNRHSRRAALKQPLFQVNVQTDEGVIPIGPAMTDKESVQRFCHAIAANIFTNQVKDWREPHVVRVVKE